MRIDVRSRDLSVSTDLQTHVERRLRFALARFGSRIGGVTVTLSEGRGPRGGVDTRCRIVAALSASAQLQVEVQDIDLFAAVDCAADRLGRAVGRAVDRTHNYPRQRIAAARVTGDALLQQRH